MSDKFIITTAFIITCAVSFFLTSGLLYVVCWAFGLPWSWKISVGAWVGITLLRSVFSRSKE